MSDCGGTWCRELGCKSCYPHDLTNPENMHNSTKTKYSTQTWREIAIDDIQNQIKMAKETPVPHGLWGKQIYWNTEYCQWAPVNGSDRLCLIDFPVNLLQPKVENYSTYKKMDEIGKALVPDDIESIGKNEDDVNHPSHYCNRSMEAIDIIEMIVGIEKNPMVAYNMSNVLKYLLRFRDKGTPVKDLEKAVWYLKRMIEKVKSE